MCISVIMSEKRFTLGSLQVKILLKLSKEKIHMYKMFKMWEEMRSTPIAVQNALIKLQEKKLIEQTHGKYQLTGHGNAMVEILKAQ